MILAVEINERIKRVTLLCLWWTVTVMMMCHFWCPVWGRCTPSLFFSPLSIHLPIFYSFFTFPISFSRLLYPFSSFIHPVPFSTRVVPLRFQPGGCRRRPKLGLVCSVYFVLYVLVGLDIVIIIIRRRIIQHLYSALKSCLVFCCCLFSSVLRSDSYLPLL